MFLNRKGTSQTIFKTRDDRDVPAGTEQLLDNPTDPSELLLLIDVVRDPPLIHFSACIGMNPLQTKGL